MSSTYHILCLSHDPAITITSTGYNRPEEAETAIRDGDTQHPDCDLLIARISGALTELGCPPTIGQPRAHQHQCRLHRETEWVAVAWLRILALGQAAGVLPAEVLSGPYFRCWPDVRLQRLRHELGVEIGNAEKAGE